MFTYHLPCKIDGLDCFKYAFTHSVCDDFLSGGHCRQGRTLEMYCTLIFVFGPTHFRMLILSRIAFSFLSSPQNKVTAAVTKTRKLNSKLKPKLNSKLTSTKSHHQVQGITDKINELDRTGDDTKQLILAPWWQNMPKHAKTSCQNVCVFQVKKPRLPWLCPTRGKKYPPRWSFILEISEHISFREQLFFVSLTVLSASRAGYDALQKQWNLRKMSVKQTILCGK